MSVVTVAIAGSLYTGEDVVRNRLKYKNHQRSLWSLCYCCYSDGDVNDIKIQYKRKVNLFILRCINIISSFAILMGHGMHRGVLYNWYQVGVVSTRAAESESV